LLRSKVELGPRSRWIGIGRGRRETGGAGVAAAGLHRFDIILAVDEAFALAATCSR
jgi:hypothetical protein